MPFELDITQLDGSAAVRAVSKTLRSIDARLVDHGERVAFIACELLDEGKLPLDEELLFLLSVFHDIGAYKTDEIDRMVQFETQDVWNHAIYGYLFIKYMTPLKDAAEAILYHHAACAFLEAVETNYREYALLLHLADRIDIISAFSDDAAVKRLTDNSQNLFCPKLIRLFLGCFRQRRILEHLADDSYREKNQQRLNSFRITSKMALEYLKMIVFSIDFRSEHTVTHTINTISIALHIAKHFGLDAIHQERIYLGALLHDVGKIAIPVEILEYPGRLSPAQMEIMRTHVTETENLITGIIPEEICQIAERHHEKLDGSGYPHGLTGEVLDFSQRIVAVADIVSALGSRRSYKDPFPKEKTIAILREMQQKQLDPAICDYVCNNYDWIMIDTDTHRAAVIQRYQAMIEEFAVLKNRFDPTNDHLFDEEDSR